MHLEESCEFRGDLEDALWVKDPPGRVVTIVIPISIKRQLTLSH